MRVAAFSENAGIASLRADAAVPDFDLVLVTGEHGPGSLSRFQMAGACAVSSKASTAAELAAA